MDRAFTAAQQPGTPITGMPASTAARISSLPGSEMQGVPASVITATLLPESISLMKYLALPYSLNLWLETRRLRISSLFSSTIERRVSSAAMMSTVLRISRPRGDMSRELPMGVATM